MPFYIFYSSKFFLNILLKANYFIIISIKYIILFIFNFISFILPKFWDRRIFFWKLFLWLFEAGDRLMVQAFAFSLWYWGGLRGLPPKIFFFRFFSFCIYCYAFYRFIFFFFWFFFVVLPKLDAMLLSESVSPNNDSKSININKEISHK